VLYQLSYIGRVPHFSLCLQEVGTKPAHYCFSGARSCFWRCQNNNVRTANNPKIANVSSRSEISRGPTLICASSVNHASTAINAYRTSAIGNLDNV
jgi:hypothetical protein